MTSVTRTLVVCAIASLIIVGRSYGQETPAAISPSALSSVEIYATPARPNASFHGGLLRGGRLELHAATMFDLIRYAWRISPDQVIGGPAWLDADRFELFATGPADTTPETVGPMLQAVLVDRFRLQGHSATQPFPGYALMAGPSPRLTRGAEGDSGCSATVPPEPLPHRSVSCRNITMADFAKMLPDLAGNYFQLTAVADATGLTGSWSFTLRWTDRRFLATAGADGIPIYDALSRQLGLRLETRDVPLPVFVVENVARTPTPNLSNKSRPAETGSPEFEVATIKLSLSRDRPVVRRMPAGRLELRGFTLRQLIKFAWDFKDNDVKDNDELLHGGPASWPDQGFDILASGQLTDQESIRLMLRALLIDRFRISSHSEQRPVQVYELIAPTPKLQKSAGAGRPGCRNTPALPTRAGAPGPVFALRCRNIAMAQFAAKLQGMGGIYTPHPVMDATGLTGAWDFTLSWSPPHLLELEGVPSDSDASLTIVEALRQQLGLRLRLRPHPMTVLVIDHVETSPVSN